MAIFIVLLLSICLLHWYSHNAYSESSSTSNITLLKQPTLKIIDRVAEYNYRDFGKVLLGDETGIRTSQIADANHNIWDTVSSIFSRWCEGTGKLPVTWDTLVDSLYEIGLKELATYLNDTVHVGVYNISKLTPTWNSEWRDQTGRQLNVITEPPSMNFLGQPPISLIDEIDENKMVLFEVLLLNDLTGDVMMTIMENNNNTRAVCRQICKRWLEGKETSKPATWNVLINVLNATKQHNLVSIIQNSVDVSVLNTPALPYHSEVVIATMDFLKRRYIHQPVIEVGQDVPFFNILVKDSTHATTVSIWTQLGKLHSNKIKRLIITGQPGAGKTTLMRHLAKEWAKGRVLQSCQILFLIDFSHIERNNMRFKSLSDVLKRTNENMTDIEDVAQEIIARQGAGACFLLDTYYNEWNYEDFVYDLIFLRVLDLSRCIITAREWKYDNEMQTNEIEHVEILGFNNKYLELYLQEYPIDDRDREKVRRIWTNYPIIEELCTLPLYFTMITSIVEEKFEQKIHSRTEIYMAFVDMIISKYKKVLKLYSLWHCMPDSTHGHARNHELCRAFEELHGIAFRVFFNHSTNAIFSKGSIKMINELGLARIIEYKGLHWTPGTKIQCKFIHPTFLEFFAAIHLTTLASDVERIYNTIPKAPIATYVNFWSYFFGLLSKGSNTENIFEILKHISAHFNRLSSGVCKFEVNTQLFDIIREIELHNVSINLTSAGIIVNKSLCVRLNYSPLSRGEFEKMKLINDILKYVNTFQFTFSYGKRQVSVLLGNSHNFEDYLNITYYLYSEGSMNDTYPSVVAIMGDYHLLKMLDLKAKRFPGIRSLQITSVGTKKMGITVLELIKTFHCLDMLKISLNCSLLPLMLSNPDQLLGIQHIRFELKYCDKNAYNDIIRRSPDYPYPWDFPYPIHISQMCFVMHSALTTIHRLKALTILGSQGADISVLVHGLTQLETLRLIKVNLSDTNINHLLETWKQSHHLRELEVTYTELKASVFNCLCSQLPHSIEELNLSNNQLNDDQVVVLSTSLAYLFNLRSLNLSHNKISNTGMKQLSKVLTKSHRMLHSLDLSDNLSCGKFKQLAGLTDIHCHDFKKDSQPTVPKDSSPWSREIYAKVAKYLWRYLPNRLSDEYLQLLIEDFKRYNLDTYLQCIFRCLTKIFDQMDLQIGDQKQLFHTFLQMYYESLDNL